MAERPVAGRQSRGTVLTVEALAEGFRAAIRGPDSADSPDVIWSDGDAQLLLRAAKLRVRTAGNALLVAVDTESAEFGPSPLAVRFMFGAESGPASLVAATDATAFGQPELAARWGDLFRDVIWAAFARQVEVLGKGLAPAALRIGADRLRLSFAKPVSIAGLAEAHVQDLIAQGRRAPLRRRREPPARPRTA